jgi:hypothetical protein
MGLEGGAVVLNGLKTFAKAFGVAALIIDPIVEIFTGKISEALNPEGGFLARIGGIVTSAFTAIPNMLFDVLGFVFGEEMFVGRLRNSFDTIVAYVNAAFKGFLGGLVGGAAGLLQKILPKDSKLAKFLDEAAQGLVDSSLQNQKVGEQLWNDNSLTLAKISEKNKKSAEGAAKTTDAATAKATAAQEKFNNVQYGMDLTRAGVINDAKAILGSPQVQTPVAVKPATVNTPDETAKPSAAKTASDQAIAALGGPEMLVALNSILAVMRENLVQEQRQAEATELLVKGNRPMAYFTPAEIVADRVLNQGYVT